MHKARFTPHFCILLKCLHRLGYVHICARGSVGSLCHIFHEKLQKNIAHQDTPFKNNVNGESVK